MLHCQNLNFSYHNKQILRNVSLQFSRGRFIALLGKNGAGKSTLLKCLCGLETGTADVLTVQGINMATAGRSEIAQHISFVPQEHEDMFPFEVLDVVVMGRTVFLGAFGSPAASDYKIARNALSELNVQHLEKRIYTTLSGGEKQLVLLARALVQSRGMVFLDEPTNHLDYKNRYHMLAKLRELSRKHNSCIVACLHDPNHALAFADEVVMLKDGTVLDHGPVKQVMTGEVISRLYDIATAQYCSEGMTTIQPCFTSQDYRGKVLLLVGESGAGKTTLLQKVVAAHHKLLFGGVLCPGTMKNGRRYSISIMDIKKQSSIQFARRQEATGKDLGPLVFFEDGKKFADEALATESHLDDDCIIIDEVGPLELKGEGYGEHLAPLLGLKKSSHIWAVRPSIVEDVITKWMLIDPVVINVRDDDALERVHNFLESWRE